MIEFVRGNLFDAKVEAITNAVHCVGVMGKGIAREWGAEGGVRVYSHVWMESGSMRPTDRRLLHNNHTPLNSAGNIRTTCS
jgi:hypothetical protein